MNVDLVIDANVVISALIAPKGKTLDLIFSDRFRLFAPKFLFEEIHKHEDEISDKSGLTLQEIDTVLTLVSVKIMIVQKEEFTMFLDQAKLISPDPDDEEYFALALRLDAAIWSQDKKLKKQDTVKIFTTTDLLESEFDE